MFTIDLTQVQLRLPEELVQEIDKLVKTGKFKNRSDAIRHIGEEINNLRVGRGPILTTPCLDLKTNRISPRSTNRCEWNHKLIISIGTGDICARHNSANRAPGGGPLASVPWEGIGC